MTAHRILLVYILFLILVRKTTQVDLDWFIKRTVKTTEFRVSCLDTDSGEILNPSDWG